MSLPAPLPAPKAGEYESVSPVTLLWIAYISSVCGCIFSVVLKGLFGISIASGSSIITDIAIIIATPERDQIRGFNEGALIAVTIFAGLGSFFSGLVLSSKGTSGGKASFIKMLYPSVDSWTLRHQFHVTVCMACLAAAHAIVASEVDPAQYKSLRYKSKLVQNSGAYLFAVLLLAFTMSALSTLLTLNQQLMLRGGNFTSQVFDCFAGLGFAARSRDCRYLWKAHMLFWSFAGFTAGSCIGANAYETTFAINSVSVPIIMVSPLWFTGVVFLVLRKWRSSAAAAVGLNEHLIQQPVAASGSTEAAVKQVAAGSNVPVAGEYEVLDRKQFFWIAYCCFVAG
jgi:hypothetical protein